MTPEDQAAWDRLIAAHLEDPCYFYDIRYVSDSLVHWNISRRSQVNPYGGVIVGHGLTFSDAVGMALESKDLKES